MIKGDYLKIEFIDFKSKLWIEYCSLWNKKPTDKGLQNSVYYLRGFKEWKRLQGEFNYYRYMSYNF